MPDNLSSKKSNFKIGATIEGVWKDHVVINGKILDVELISILKKNFKKQYAKIHWKWSYLILYAKIILSLKELINIIIYL